MKITILCLFVLLCACRDQRPPAPTAEQANQLNEAENMLNDVAANEDGPPANAAAANSQIR